MVSKFKDRDASHLYSVIWRWHFYCGLVFTPIVILLAKAIQQAMHQDAPPGRSPHAFKSVYSKDSQRVPVNRIARFVRDLELEGEIRIGLPVKNDSVYHVVSRADDPAKQRSTCISINTAETWLTNPAGRITRLPPRRSLLALNSIRAITSACRTN